ncbi:hypothetical protein DPSP01_006596 [Paraphaeosphaeria sporulosa]
MSAAPTTPRYTRPTAAWQTWVTPERSSVRYPARPHLKRPPRLLLMSPRDPTQPCLFSRLPRELRLQIYECVLPRDLFLAPASGKYMCGMKERFKPALLHVCGLVRLEVATLLYGSTRITYKLTNFDFRPFEQWVTTIPKEHVNYMSRNKNLIMDLSGHIFPPITKKRFELCDTFGNRYLIPKGNSYNQFINFCLLAHWTQWCGNHSIPKKLHWNYRFGINTEFGSEADTFSVLRSFHKWFSSYLWTIAQPNVQNAWLRNVRRRTMKRELQKMLESIERAWRVHHTRMEDTKDADTRKSVSYSASAYASLRDDWATRVAIVKEVISSW